MTSAIAFFLMKSGGIAILNGRKQDFNTAEASFGINSCTFIFTRDSTILSPKVFDPYQWFSAGRAFL